MADAKKLPSGSWRVLLYVGTDAAGKRRYESFTAPTKKGAEFLAAEYKFKHDGEARDRVTLGYAFDDYIASKSDVLSPSTLRTYKSIRKNYLQSLMKKDINSITQKDLQKAINEEAKHLSPKTLRNITGLLVPVMTMHRPSFSVNLTLPQKEKDEFYIPDEATMKRIYEKAKGKRIELPILLASQLGLRASEIAGLTYECVNKEQREITIKQARVYSGDGNVLKAPKSYAGNRTLSVPKHIIDMIGEGSNEEFVLNLTSNAITKQWMRFMEGTEEKYFNFHALRHYFCSTCILIGAPKKYVAEIMGHCSENMINKVYEHTFADKKKEFGDLITSHFER